MMRSAAALACLLASTADATPEVAKVKVFIMMGQSNMLGEGKIGGPGAKDINGTLEYAVTTDKKYP